MWFVLSAAVLLLAACAVCAVMQWSPVMAETVAWFWLGLVVLTLNPLTLIVVGAVCLKSESEFCMCSHGGALAMLLCGLAPFLVAFVVGGFRVVAQSCRSKDSIEEI